MASIFPNARAGVFATTAARVLGRALVASYFVHAALAALQSWHHFRRHPEQLAALRRWQSDPPPAPPPFPWLEVLAVLPAAVAQAVASARTWPAAVVLLLWIVWQDGRSVTLTLRAIALHGSRPTELLAKPLAICGAAALLLAAAVSEARRGAPVSRGAWAGPLREEEDTEDEDGGGVGGAAGGSNARATAGRRLRRQRRRSVLLLAGRVLMGALLAYLGWMQVQRMSARRARAAAAAAAAASAAGAAQEPPLLHHYGAPDARDNPLVLVQTALGALVVLGVVARPAAALLAAALLAEAGAFLQFWRPMPGAMQRAALRERFFVDAALAGGALLLSSLGAGGYAVDAVAAAARKRQ